MRRVSMFRIGVLIVIVLLSGCTGQAIVYSDEYVPGQDQQYWFYVTPCPDCPMLESDDGYFLFLPKLSVL